MLGTKKPKGRQFLRLLKLLWGGQHEQTPCSLEIQCFRGSPSRMSSSFNLTICCFRYLELENVDLEFFQAHQKRIQYEITPQPPAKTSCQTATAETTEDLAAVASCAATSTLRTHLLPWTRLDPTGGEVGWWRNYPGKMGDLKKKNTPWERFFFVEAWKSWTLFFFWRDAGCGISLYVYVSLLILTKSMKDRDETWASKIKCQPSTWL